ncbi:MAG TPA: DUF2508 family protein [Clostridia bacterium]|nr:MAG: hypothetical protein BWY35_01067 [Firmicutes bacterium ADurb.Bin248]HOG00019.1 DUF2508 family protein [Clostridia bacterium]HOS18599.1 DUF2508 family protein [Clostridia bacterium]HPK14496.1 DUF2508 family protein [Clostridia bacterium]
MAIARLNAAQSAQHEDVAAALARWKASMEYYQNVKDPDLIEFAIYDMEAARRKYVFLLKRSKEA